VATRVDETQEICRAGLLEMETGVLADYIVKVARHEVTYIEVDARLFHLMGDAGTKGTEHNSISEDVNRGSSKMNNGGPNVATSESTAFIVDSVSMLVALPVTACENEVKTPQTTFWSELVAFGLAKSRLRILKEGKFWVILAPLGGYSVSEIEEACPSRPKNNLCREVKF